VCSDPAQTPEALKQETDRYLIENAVANALRSIYGERGLRGDERKRIAHDLTRELQLRGVTIKR
jgi:hypothetical protein